MKTISSSILIFWFFFPILGFASRDIEKVKEDYESLLDRKYILLPHADTFLLPISYSNNPNKRAYEPLTSGALSNGKGKYNKNLEAEFQFSFMLLTGRKVFSTDLNVFAAYTQQSWWQVYNGDWSRQFRETNYSPEVFARKVFSNPKSILGGKFVAYDFGLIHQSNGQAQGLSRGWNRVFLRFALVFGRTFVKTTLWYRIPDPLDRDDNPDIYKYMGYGSITIEHLFEKSRVRLRLIPGTKRQGAELGYSYPWRKGLRAYTKIGYGYGHSLIDYNHHSEKVGVGVILTDLLSN